MKSLIVLSVALLASSDAALRASLGKGCPNVTHAAVNHSNAIKTFYRTFSTDTGAAAGCTGCMTVRVSPLNSTFFNVTHCCDTLSGVRCDAEVGSGVITTNPVTNVVSYTTNGVTHQFYELAQDGY